MLSMDTKFPHKIKPKQNKTKKRLACVCVCFLINYSHISEYATIDLNHTWISLLSDSSFELFKTLFIIGSSNLGNL